MVNAVDAGEVVTELLPDEMTEEEMEAVDDGDKGCLMTSFSFSSGLYAALLLPFIDGL